MFDNHQAFTTVVVWEISLISVSVLGDRCQRFFESDRRLFAASDNLIHGAIGFLSWAVYIGCSLKARELLQCLTCAVMAMGLDIDHFLAAKSLTLKKALSLQSRPPFHATTLIPIVALCLYFICRVLSSKSSDVITLLFVLSWTSHHIRDGLRRGIWLWPFGSTPPIPFWMYTLLIAALPVLLKTVIYVSYQRFYIETEQFTQKEQFNQISPV